MLLRFDPFRDVERELDRLASMGNGGYRPTVMPMDAWRQGDRFFVRIDLPGVDPASVDLTVEKDVLTVSAERRWERGDGEQVLAAERPQGRWSRQLFLGDALDVERIEARYEHGVLTIMLPVAEAAKPRKVSVTTGDTGAHAIATESSDSKAHAAA
jgi:HSP20 family protein